MTYPRRKGSQVTQVTQATQVAQLYTRLQIGDTLLPFDRFQTPMKITDVDVGDCRSGSGMCMLHRALDRQRYDRAPDHDRCGAASSSIFDFRFSTRSIVDC